MALLLDTSVLVRLANAADAYHGVASHAVVELRRRGDTLHITPQALAEFWVVVTRPVPVNGLGLSATEAEAQIAYLEATFALLEDTPAIYPAWRELVCGLGVTGKTTHDARFVATCRALGIAGMLTFNLQHFNRLASFWPGIAVVDPATI